MQTFLPYPDYAASAKVLDRQRLGKQRVENLQIIKALLDPTYGWQNHPAVKMWAGYEASLIEYGNVCIKEWIRRGYKNNMPLITVQHSKMPWWIGNDDFHTSHKSALLFKKPDCEYVFGKMGR